MGKLIFAAVALGLGALLSINSAHADSPSADPAWSDWQTHRGHFEFQFKVEQVASSVMRMRLRIRPDVAKIRAEPHYSGEKYFVEYYQTIRPADAGGFGALTDTAPRRLAFPHNAPATCVFEDPDGLYAPIETADRAVRLYMDSRFKFPVLDENGTLKSGVLSVLSFGNAVGPEAIVKFLNVDRSAFKNVC